MSASKTSTPTPETDGKVEDNSKVEAVTATDDKKATEDKAAEDKAKKAEEAKAAKAAEKKAEQERKAQEKKEAADKKAKDKAEADAKKAEEREAKKAEREAAKKAAAEAKANEPSAMEKQYGESAVRASKAARELTGSAGPTPKQYKYVVDALKGEDPVKLIADLDPKMTQAELLSIADGSAARGSGRRLQPIAERVPGANAWHKGRNLAATLVQWIAENKRS